MDRRDVRLPKCGSRHLHSPIVPCLSMFMVCVPRYGYVLGAAKANVWHNPADYFHWMYPGYFTSGAPKLRVALRTCLLHVLGYSPNGGAAQSRRGYCTMACSGR